MVQGQTGELSKDTVRRPHAGTWMDETATAMVLVMQSGGDLSAVHLSQVTRDQMYLAVVAELRLRLAYVGAAAGLSLNATREYLTDEVCDVIAGQVARRIAGELDARVGD